MSAHLFVRLRILVTAVRQQRMAHRNRVLRAKHQPSTATRDTATRNAKNTQNLCASARAFRSVSDKMYLALRSDVCNPAILPFKLTRTLSISISFHRNNVKYTPANDTHERRMCVHVRAAMRALIITFICKNCLKCAYKRL